MLDCFAFSILEQHSASWIEQSSKVQNTYCSWSAYFVFGWRELGALDTLQGRSLGTRFHVPALPLFIPISLSPWSSPSIHCSTSTSCSANRARPIHPQIDFPKRVEHSLCVDGGVHPSVCPLSLNWNLRTAASHVTRQAARHSRDLAASRTCQ